MCIQGLQYKKHQKLICVPLCHYGCFGISAFMAFILKKRTQYGFGVLVQYLKGSDAWCP